jgi:hypothetical protein
VEKEQKKNTRSFGGREKNEKELPRRKAGVGEAIRE